MDLNQFHLIGRLTRDVEIKYTQSGVPVGRLSIANNQKQKKNGQWVDVTSFFDIALFGKSAQNLFQYLTKGKQLAISGTFRQDKWQDANGNHSKISLIATHVQLLGDRQNQNQNAQNNGNRQNTNGMTPQQQQQFAQDQNALQQSGLVEADADFFPEEIPF